MSTHLDVQRTGRFEHPEPEQRRGGDAGQPSSDSDRPLHLIGDARIDVDALPRSLEFSAIDGVGDLPARDSGSEQFGVRADATVLRGDVAC